MTRAYGYPTAITRHELQQSCVSLYSVSQQYYTSTNLSGEEHGFSYRCSSVAYVCILLRRLSTQPQKETDIVVYSRNHRIRWAPTLHQ
jgi:hypothetical protein